MTKKLTMRQQAVFHAKILPGSRALEVAPPKQPEPPAPSVEEWVAAGGIIEVLGESDESNRA